METGSRRQEKPVGSVELRQLRYFVAVAEERHFGRAAERLRIAQPGLSQQIKKLERSIGVELLIRDPRGVKLTAAGRAFLDQARLALELTDRAVTSAVMAERGRKGLLRLGTPALGMPPASEAVLQQFVERFAEVEVEIHPGLSPQHIDGLATHSLDLAFVMSPFKTVDPPPRFLQLGRLELMVALPEGHPLADRKRIARSQLLKEPFLDWPRSANPTLVDHIHRTLFGAFEHPRSVAVPELVEARRLLLVAKGRGLAVSILPSVAERRFPGVVFRPLDEPAPVVGYGVAWTGTHPSPFVPSFLEVARELRSESA